MQPKENFIVICLFAILIFNSCNGFTRKEEVSIEVLDSLLIHTDAIASIESELNAIAKVYVFLDGNCSCSAEEMIAWSKYISNNAQDQQVDVVFVLFGNIANAPLSLHVADFVKGPFSLFYYSENLFTQNQSFLKLYNQSVIYVENTVPLTLSNREDLLNKLN